MHEKLTADVAVIGGGVTGLFLTRMLAERGFKVVLIEKGEALAGGPSTRNEGWLHSGAYHVAAILDRTTAVQIARRVKFGYEHVRGFVPEAIEEPKSMTFALVDEEKRDEVISRWDEAEVMYVPVSREDFNDLAPQVNIDEVAGIFRVPDMSINVRILYKKLASRALELGSTILTNTAIESIQDAGTSRLSRPDGNPGLLECRLYVYAAGYGIKDLFKSLFDVDLPVRCWVSHLLDLPRVLKHGVFCLNPGQSTIMHHGRWSIVGTNADQIKAPSPPSGPDDDIVNRVKYSLRRQIRDVRLENSHGRACVKVDIDPGEQAVSGVLGVAPPQLSVSCGEPVPNHIWVLPGKMTEAPFLADFLTSYIIREKLGNPSQSALGSSPSTSVLSQLSPAIAPRPIDGYTFDSNVSRSETDWEDFDVFLSHNSKDKETVRRLAILLQGRGLKVWLDEWQLIPGRPWQEALESIIRSTKCAAVLVGKDGLGPWEEPEMRACLNQFVRRKMPVIPVLLPGASEKPELPLFLQGFTWVDLTRGFHEDGISRLVWGITGQKGNEKLQPPVSTTHPIVTYQKGIVTGELLIGRKAELARLDKAWSNKRINVMSIVAWAGVGKSALVSHWLDKMARQRYAGADRVFYWSFYSLGGSYEKAASVDEFVEKALHEFDDSAHTKGSLWDRTQRLVAKLRSCRTLLILDGLEPLQHPPGPMRGRLKDPSMRLLIGELALDNPGLCVITTREQIPEISHLVQTAPRIDLGDLHPDDGADLLKQLGVKGTKKDLRQTSIEFEGHALTLTLLATYLRDMYAGDVRRRDKVELLEGDEERGRHAKGVMASYVKWFGEGPKIPEIAVLKLLGLFDRRAGAASLDALREVPTIDGLTNPLFLDHFGTLIPIEKTEWMHVLQRLRQAHLLLPADTDAPQALDAHPLVREYFRAYLRDKFPESWRLGNARLYEYFKHASPIQPMSRADIESLYSAVIHACRAGLHEEALEDIYWPRIHQGSKGHSHRNLGAYEAELAMLSEFFESSWDKPYRHLEVRTKATVLGLAGSRLRALGRLPEAVDPLRRSLVAHEKSEDRLLAAVRARHLSEVHMTLGDLQEALKCAREELRLTEESEELMSSSLDSTEEATTKGKNKDNIIYEKIVQLTIQGTILHQLGNWVEAQKSFVAAEEMQKQVWPDLSVLFSLWGFRYCDLLLDQLEFIPDEEFGQQCQLLQERLADMRELPEDVLERTVPETNLALVGKGLEDLFMAKFTLIKSRKSRDRDLIEVKAGVWQAIDNLRIASRPEYIPLGLLTRAALYCEMGDLKSAERDLNDSLQIVKHGSMKLYEVDCHLHFVRLHLQQFQHSNEKRHLEKASQDWSIANISIEKLGYGRRIPELRSLEASFPTK